MSRFTGVAVLLILMLTIVGAVSPAYADASCSPAFPSDCVVSNSGNIEVVAGHSGSNTVTLSGIGGVFIDTGNTVVFSGGLFSGPPVVGCTSVLPTGAACSFNPTGVLVPPSTTSESSSLTITTSPTTPPGTYPVTVEVGFISGGAGLIAPVFSIQQQQLHPEQGEFAVFTTQFNLIIDPAPPIPEYPFGLAVLGIFMIIAYGVIRRKTRYDHN